MDTPVRPTFAPIIYLNSELFQQTHSALSRLLLFHEILKIPALAIARAGISF